MRGVTYHLLILDDLAYVTKDQAETSVLFELISARYERRSMLITAINRSANGAKSSRIKP
jgi:DNA replication protein DnaC